MNCYGRYSITKEICKKCKMAKWCKEAADPKLLAAYETDCSTLSQTTESDNELTKSNNFPTQETHCYSKYDLMEIIAFMASLDLATLDMIDEKLKNPAVSFSDIARSRKVSRQAVHKQIKKKCSQIPELETILRNRKNNLKNSVDFMEEVWQIKKKMSKKKLQKPRSASNFSKPLTYLSRNLDLSRMSIFKGANCLNLG